MAAGATVISRLRCDAALWSLPPVIDPGQKRSRGRPLKCGKDRLSLAKRAAQTRGWQKGMFSHGRPVVKKYKTFLATYRPVGGVIRVVLVREPDRRVAYFSTHPDLSVASILETVADRSALEQVFHDVKEVHGASQQQLRHVWANVGGVEPDRLVAHAGGAVGLGPVEVPVAQPERFALGQGGASSVARQSLSGVTSQGDAGRIVVAPVRGRLSAKIPPVHSAPDAPGRMRRTILGMCRRRGSRE
jgi:hypothetical protein